MLEAVRGAFRLGLLTVGLVPLTGCHSAFVEATLVNRTARPVTLVELDYPSASFGLQQLAPGESFHYRFKILGSGELKLIYTDAAEKEQHITGPHLDEGEEGPLEVAITPAGTQWNSRVHAHSSH